jgi:hypothetical protein
LFPAFQESFLNAVAERPNFNFAHFFPFFFAPLPGHSPLRSTPLCFFCKAKNVQRFFIFCFLTALRRGKKSKAKNGLCPSGEEAKKAEEQKVQCKAWVRSLPGQKDAERQKEAVQMVQKGGFVLQKSHVFKKF